jgi:hypothetical protein
MLAEVGRRADFALTPATAVVRVKREAENLVWDDQHVAGDLRRSDGTAQVPLGHPYTVVHADFWSRLTALRMSKLHCALRDFLRYLGGKSE